MDMQLVAQKETDQLTTEDCTSIDTPPAPDDLENRSIEDPSSKHRQDHPALIAWVAHLSKY
jgi:hypothetical protein